MRRSPAVKSGIFLWIIFIYQHSFVYLYPQTKKTDIMKAFYNLVGYDLKKQYFLENVDFTSKKKALQSLAYIREYYIKKLELNTTNVRNYGETSDDQFRVELDDRVSFTLTKKYIYTQVIKYV